MSDPLDMIKSKQFINNLLNNIQSDEDDSEGILDPVSYLINYRTIEIKTPRKFDRSTYIADCLNNNDDDIAIVVNDIIRDWMINTYSINPDQIFTSDKFIEDSSNNLGDVTGTYYIDQSVFQSVSGVDKNVIYAIIDEISGLDTMIVII